MRKDLILHFGALAILLFLELLGFFSDYHQGNFARILVLAAYGIGYNVLFGYTGLLSLGHALFFSAGLYASGLSIYHLDYNVCLLYTSPSPRDSTLSRMPSSA